MAKSNIVLNVEVRDRTGKGGARAARTSGKIPGILYGGALKPVSITLDAREVGRAVKSGKFLAHTVTLSYKGENQLVFAQDIQFHPVTDEAIHLDLYRVEENQLIRVSVPVRTIGDGVSPGLKRGGTLNLVRHRIEVMAPAGAIPEFFEIDISSLDIGDAVKISAVSLPDNVTPVITDRDFTIATLQGRGGKALAEEAAEDAAAAAAAAASAAAAPAKGGKAAAPAKGAAPAKAAPAKAPAKK